MKPVGERPKCVATVAVVKRSGRLSKKGTSLNVTSADALQDERAVKRRSCTRSAAIEPVKQLKPGGGSLLAGAVEKKRKATRKRGSTGNTTGTETTTSCPTTAAVGGAKGQASSKPGRAAACRKRASASGTATNAANDDGKEARGRPETDRKPAATVRGSVADKKCDAMLVHADETDDGSAALKDVADELDQAVAVLAAADGDEQQDQFERDVLLLSKRFQLPRDALAEAIERDAMPVFRERFSRSVTRSMMVVSPAVVASTKSAGRPRGVRYTVEPARRSAVFGAASLKGLMDELAKTMPSWSLSVVAEPHRYVISRTTVDTFGAPVLDRSVVLDRQFRASVYVDGCLRYEYCKRYETAVDIVNLINELNDVALPTDDATQHI